MYNPAVYQYFDIALTNFSDRKIKTAVLYLWKEVYPIYNNIEVTIKKCKKEIDIIIQLKIDQIRVQYTNAVTYKLIKRVNQAKKKMIEYISLFKNNQPLTSKELCYKKGISSANQHIDCFCWTDGSFVADNLGTIGYILKKETGEVIFKGSEDVDCEDSVSAELLGIKQCLYKAMYYGIKNIVLFSDSESAIYQIKHIKNQKYRKIVKQILHLINYFNYISINKIDRVYNKEADSLT